MHLPSAEVQPKNVFLPQSHSILLNLGALTPALALQNPTLNAQVVTHHPPFVPRPPLALSSSGLGGSMLADLYPCVLINHDAVG